MTNNISKNIIKIQEKSIDFYIKIIMTELEEIFIIIFENDLKKVNLIMSNNCKNSRFSNLFHKEKEFIRNFGNKFKSKESSNSIESNFKKKNNSEQINIIIDIINEYINENNFYLLPEHRNIFFSKLSEVIIKKYINVLLSSKLKFNQLKQIEDDYNEILFFFNDLSNFFKDKEMLYFDENLKPLKDLIYFYQLFIKNDFKKKNFIDDIQLGIFYN
jgi:hypothetical protein